MSVQVGVVMFLTRSFLSLILMSNELCLSFFPSLRFPDDPDVIYDLFRSFSTNKAGFVPRTHTIFKHWADAVINMPGKLEVTIANVFFNVTPIKTAYAPANDALSSLKSKVVVIYGSKDSVVPAQTVEKLRNSALDKNWSPPGMLSFHDDEEGHMVLIDKPNAFAEVYRKVFEEQILI